MRPGVRALWILATVAAAGVAGWWAWDALHQEAPDAPDFTLTDTGYENGTFRGQETFYLSDYRGKTVVLDFMAYNCAACRVVTPRIMEVLHERHGDRPDFAILTIDVGEFSNFPGSTEENLVKWQTEEHRSPWRHALDTHGAFLPYARLGGIGLPAVFVVDPEGRIVFQATGIPKLAEVDAAVEGSLAGSAQPARILQVGIIGLALVAGVASFVAPCSVGLIPAYLALLLSRRGRDGEPAEPVWMAGLQAAAGIVCLYAALALLLWFARDAISHAVPWLGPLVGVAFIVLGVLLAAGVGWDRMARALGQERVDGRRGFFAFGVGYGLAAFGCTGPIFLPILVAGFAQGAALGVAAFAAYTAAILALILVATYLVHAGRQTLLRRLLADTWWVQRASGVLLVVAGLYLVWFDVAAFR